ncbi:acetyltransferase [Methylorubrum extorquens]|uniref:PglD N-terminal domain-containing protein n=1 Tax=Methylorubrum extorquens (strain CM4 / NCIMB 13688) TaxID=440085 RepID=B7KYN5_METC4|nr:acetyltransferase [Methylorubrum extorquens]ACK84786.1 conserved hypothetical protein [Methylorubrum extorquens CM4]
MAADATGSRAGPPSLLILGAGGAAREIAGFASECVEPYRPVAFVVADDEPTAGTRLADLPVLSLSDAQARFPAAAAVIAIGSAAIRRRLAQDLDRAGLGAATLVHRSVVRGPRVAIGLGTILAPGTVISCDVAIGRHAYVNLGCTISHDSVLEDFVTLAPGVSVPGSVHIESGTFVGVGVSFVHGRPDKALRIGRDATVGAGACVTADVAPATTVVGVPARPIAD